MSGDLQTIVHRSARGAIALMDSAADIRAGNAEIRSRTVGCRRLRRNAEALSI